MKYHKKITGPTLFSDETDAEKPGWVFLCDSLYSPHLEEKYHSVIQTFQKQGQAIKKRKKTQKRTLNSIRSKMSSVNIGGMGFGKSSKQMVKKDSSPSRSKSPTKDRCSLTKISVIEEVRESRDGQPSLFPDTNIGIGGVLNRDSNLTPSRERADTMKSNSPFKVNIRNSENRGAKIKKKVKKCINHDHEVPDHIKKSPRW